MAATMAPISQGVFILACLISSGLVVVAQADDINPGTSPSEFKQSAVTAMALPPALIEIGNTRLNISFTPGDIDLPAAQLVDWIAADAQAVAHFYGRFPVSHAQIIITPVAGSGVKSGRAYGYRAPTIHIKLGRHTQQMELERDWVMTHEMVHLAFPNLADEHTWLEEGLATYIEPVARAQLGQVSAEQVWGELVSGIPQGLPQPGDQGLDHTPTWGRTYWGGALFCLLADLEIRRRTENNYSLQDALRAILSSGGNIEAAWPLARALKIGDAATGTSVLSELYEEMKAAPVYVDLGELWRRLGVEVQGDLVTLDEAAPFAAVRRAITGHSAGMEP